MGNVQTEDVTGANAGAATSTKAFLTITEISASGTNSTANIKAGVATATSATSEDAAGDNEIRGKGGDDIIFGYAGGDRISGDGGNDFIDGGDDGRTSIWMGSKGYGCLCRCIKELYNYDLYENGSGSYKFNE